PAGVELALRRAELPGRASLVSAGAVRPPARGAGNRAAPLRAPCDSLQRGELAGGAAVHRRAPARGGRMRVVERLSIALFTVLAAFGLWRIAAVTGVSLPALALSAAAVRRL